MNYFENIYRVLTTYIKVLLENSSRIIAPFSIMAIIGFKKGKFYLVIFQTSLENLLALQLYFASIKFCCCIHNVVNQ